MACRRVPYKFGRFMYQVHRVNGSPGAKDPAPLLATSRRADRETDFHMELGKMWVNKLVYNSRL